MPSLVPSFPPSYECFDIDDSKNLITVGKNKFMPICEWASKSSKERCEEKCPCDGYKTQIKNLCRKTCNNCFSSIPPSVEPSLVPSISPSYECVDIDDSKNLITVGRNKFTPICEWASNNIKERCEEKCPCDGYKTPIKNLCRKTCNNCIPSMPPSNEPSWVPSIPPSYECIDIDDSKNLITVGQKQFEPICEWASKSPQERCEERCPCDGETVIKDLCRKTCSNCRVPLAPDIVNSCAGLLPHQRFTKIYIKLIPVSGSLLTGNTPQNKAFKWLIEDDCVQLCPDDPFLIQRYVLALLYFSTSGMDWIGSEFLSCKHECGWFVGKVECNSKMKISKLVLDNNNLKGTIPFELYKLEFLDELNLKSNALNGLIPTSVGKLQMLQTIDLSRNNLKGSIPSLIFELKNLSELQLNDNNLDGTIPLQIGNAENLSIVQLYNNELVGQIPNLLKLDNLEVFRVHENNLNGNINLSVCPLKKKKMIMLWAPCKVDCKCCNNASSCNTSRTRKRNTRHGNGLRSPWKN